MSTDAAERGWVATDTEFGARLALVRQKMGWGNLKEAALACGQPVESWRNWERDGRKPRDVVTVARAISDHTGCDFDWLLRGPNPGASTNSGCSRRGGGVEPFGGASEHATALLPVAA